jgi:hypothetical protein
MKRPLPLRSVLAVVAVLVVSVTAAAAPAPDGKLDRALLAARHGGSERVIVRTTKVLDGKGNGRTSDVSRALEFAITNRALFGIGVVNLSLGHPVFVRPADDPLVQASDDNIVWSNLSDDNIVWGMAGVLGGLR